MFHRIVPPLVGTCQNTDRSIPSGLDSYRGTRPPASCPQCYYQCDLHADKVPADRVSKELRSLNMPDQISRRETLRRGLAATSLLALLQDLPVPALAQGETD